MEKISKVERLQPVEIDCQAEELKKTKDQTSELKRLQAAAVRLTMRVRTIIKSEPPKFFLWGLDLVHKKQY
jgi:hypothetical protein